MYGQLPSTLDFTDIILEAVAGLVLFLYGVTRLSDSLKRLAGDRMKNILAKSTVNPLAGVLTGTVACTILDSSSVTIIMVIALVNAGALPFDRSLGVIMGANIGTTISSQIFALKLNEYSPVLLAIGFLVYVLAKKRRTRYVGLNLFGIGLVLFGLETIGKAAEPLKDYRPFLDWMTGLETPLAGVGVGAIFTVLIQSSSATLGIIIILASKGLVPLTAGIGIMLGAEIGTCADTLVATLGRSRAAVRAGIFHLLFNLATVALGVLFAAQLAGLAKWLAGGGGNVSRQIANAHVLFNVAGVVLFVGFTPLIARGLTRLIPDREKSPASEPKAKSPSPETQND
ncbi:MAG: Na/Pi cotransporter family protein [Ferruginibacter sp.]|nr:Na/Pi cotransporter family protein [Cytophagales bacterium]